MNAVLRYYTKTGNTKKIVEAMAKAIGCEAASIDSPLTEKADVLFLGNSVYAANIDKEVKDFLVANKENIGCLVNVSSAALLESTYGKMKKLCEELGIRIEDREFHCKGQFKFMHKGRPDENDLDEASAFAKEIIMDYKNI